jgi:hypothetical protein
MRRHTLRKLALRTLALALGISLGAIAISASARAASMDQGSLGSRGTVTGEVTGALPGEVLWTYYQTLQDGLICPPDSNVIIDNICNTDSGHAGGAGPASDNIIRLINPNGAANGNLAGAKTQTVCAMIYVFDDDQEMGECCGCPLTSAQLATFSVLENLTSNWGLTHPPVSLVSNPDNGLGAIAIVASAPNAPACKGQSVACNGGCDPTNIPGYSVTIANNLLGSITHDQEVIQPSGNISEPVLSRISGITETPLSDDGGGDPINLIYLQEQCGAIVGNGTGGGICNCPTEG